MELQITSLGAKQLQRMRNNPQNYNFVNRKGTIYLQSEYAWIEIKEKTKPGINIKSWKIHKDDTITLFLFEHHKINQNEIISLSGL